MTSKKTEEAGETGLVDLVRHQQERAEAARLYEDYQATWIDDADDMRVIATRKGSYFLPARAARTWEEHRPGMTPLQKWQDHKFWPTPEGWVFARPDEDH